VKKWTPLFQMLGNLVVSLTCGVLVSFPLRHLPRFNSFWIPDIRLIASGIVVWFVSSRIEKYHREQNAQGLAK
jgi:hypothetical protein